MGESHGADAGGEDWVYVSSELAPLLHEPAGVRVAALKRNVALRVLDRVPGYVHVTLDAWIDNDEIVGRYVPSYSSAIAEWGGATLRDAPSRRRGPRQEAHISVELGRIVAGSGVEVLEPDFFASQVRVVGWVPSEDVADWGVSSRYELWHFRFSEVQIVPCDGTAALHGQLRLIDGESATYRMTLLLYSRSGSRMTEQPFCARFDHPWIERRLDIPIEVPADSIGTYQIVRGPGVLATVR
jgi:hypothetical protein